jgi:hypothetical protein
MEVDGGLGLGNACLLDSHAQRLESTREREENPHGTRTCSHSPHQIPERDCLFPICRRPFQNGCSPHMLQFFSPSSTRTTRLQISDWRSWALEIVHTAELRQERAAHFREWRLIYITLHPTSCNLRIQRPLLGILLSQSGGVFHISAIPMVRLLHDSHPLSKPSHPCAAMAPTSTCRQPSFPMPVCAVAHFSDP